MKAVRKYIFFPRRNLDIKVTQWAAMQCMMLPKQRALPESIRGLKCDTHYPASFTRTWWRRECKLGSYCPSSGNFDAILSLFSHSLIVGLGAEGRNLRCTSCSVVMVLLPHILIRPSSFSSAGSFGFIGLISAELVRMYI